MGGIQNDAAHAVTFYVIILIFEAVLPLRDHCSSKVRTRYLYSVLFSTCLVPEALY